MQKIDLKTSKIIQEIDNFSYSETLINFLVCEYYVTFII